MKNFFKKTFVSGLKNYKAPLFSGVLLGLSFIPFPFGFLFISLVPLWYFIYSQKNLKSVLIACFLCQMIGGLVGFNWVMYTVHHFGGMNWFISFIVLIAFCSTANLYIVFAGALWFLLVKRFQLPVPARLLLLPFLFALFHPLIPTPFPWNMGYPWLWGGLPGAQTAELWGFRFLSTLFYVFNLLFLILYKHLFGKKNKKKNKKKESSFWLKIFRFSFHLSFDKTAKRALAGILVLFFSLNVGGWYLKKRLPSPDQSLNVLLVQYNKRFAGEDSRFYQGRAFRDLRRLTYRAVFSQAGKKEQRKNIDFVIWPEGAYPYLINKENREERNLSRMIRRLEVPLITGAMSKKGGKHSNSLFVFDRKGQILQPVYDKTKLLIFGEYFPLIERFPFLREIFPYFGDNLTPGKEVQVQQLEDLRLGGQICYEGLFDQISRESARKGAQLLVNVTNDSWYGFWQQPLQHLTMSFARAIEVRRPLIRATNTGHSGFISADGSVNWRKHITPLNKVLFKSYKIPYYKNPPSTLFMSWGYYINEMFLFLLAFIIIFLSLKSRKNIH